MFNPSGASNYMRDVVTDLKTSRLFQIGTVLWIPLILTAIVGFAELSAREASEVNAYDWRTRIISRADGIYYPDVTIATVDPAIQLSQPICDQRGVNVPMSGCKGQSNCYIMQFSHFESSIANTGRNHISCTFVVNGPAGANDVVTIAAPNPSYIQFPVEPRYVRPNQNIELNLFAERFQAFREPVITEWWSQVTYMSSNFNPVNGQAFTANLTAHIPFKAITQHTQYHSFDSWLLIAAWGGVFFFVLFLHKVVFGIVKLFVNNDSKILRENGAADTEYTTIK